MYQTSYHLSIQRTKARVLSKIKSTLDTYISRYLYEIGRDPMRVNLPFPKFEPVHIGKFSSKRKFLISILELIVILVISFIFRRRKQGSPSSRIVPMVPKINMEPGTSYLLPSDRPDPAFRLLTRELKKGSSAMVITRLHPEEVRARFKIGPTPVHWLSRAFTKDSLSPTNLGAIADEVENFVAKLKSPIILLDGIEYLIVQNDLQKVVRFVSTVRDAIAMHKAKMLIPFNMQSVDESGRALLTRDLHVIEWEGGK